MKIQLNANIYPIIISLSIDKPIPKDEYQIVRTSENSSTPEVFLNLPRDTYKLYFKRIAERIRFAD